MAYDYALRILTLLTTGLATPLLIATTIVSFQVSNSRWHYNRRTVTVFPFAFIAFAMTTVASTIALIYNRRHGRMPNFRFALIDFAASLVYVGLLIPIWAVEIRQLRDPGFGLLAGYTTSPMIVNMFVHMYIFARNAQFLWSWLFNEREHECPNCRSRFVATTTPETLQVGKSGERYSLLRGEDYLDEDAAAYADVRTSEDQVGVKANDEDVENQKGKGAIKI
ncbi:hypothetical protein EK21DRAFT_101492 [Setomelanomma holmii]|uniref:Uncharacterized protein n=1 Tax=Setomelanomma holmii TaxID=210430 RepID=A0A9P4LME1_9PLEO|nr:hypothetical protein EK21DRAFT_101492 [Setomelanomma holmii]